MRKMKASDYAIDAATTVREAKEKRDKIFEMILERDMTNPERPMSEDMPWLLLMEMYTRLITKLEGEQ